MEQEHHKQKSYELIHVQFLEAAQHSHSCAMPQLCNATVVQYQSCEKGLNTGIACPADITGISLVQL